MLRNGVAYEPRAAVATALGINAGLLVWAVAAGLGIAAILHASSTAFTALKLLGAAYLVWLGARALLDTSRGGSGDPPGEPRRRTAAPFRQGLLSNLFNPKIALVFTTLIPQFRRPRQRGARADVSPCRRPHLDGTRVAYRLCTSVPDARQAMVIPSGLVSSGSWIATGRTWAPSRLLLFPRLEKVGGSGVSRAGWARRGRRRRRLVAAVEHAFNLTTVLLLSHLAHKRHEGVYHP